MGKAVEQAITDHNTLKNNKVAIVLKITPENRNKLTLENLKKADVAIEFTSPSSALGNILKCIDAQVPVVTGTTGWYEHLRDITNYCKQKNGSLLYAPNFSIGVNIFFEVNKQLAKMMTAQREYAVSIIETHHTEKKDAPSGTAITLAEQIIEPNPLIQKWINSESHNPDELQIFSLREASVPGTHEVIYSSTADEIKITHTAHSRIGFAQGALKAALWLAGKKGVFTMKDVLAI